MAVSRAWWIAGLAAAAGLVVGGIAYAASPSSSDKGGGGSPPAGAITDPTAVTKAKVMLALVNPKLGLPTGFNASDPNASDPAFVAALAALQKRANDTGTWQNAGLSAPLRTDGVLDQSTYTLLSKLYAQAKQPEYVWELLSNPAMLQPGETYLVSIDPTGADPNVIAAMQAAQKMTADAGFTWTPSNCPSVVTDPQRRCTVVTVPQGATPTTLPILMNMKIYHRTIAVV